MARVRVGSVVIDCNDFDAMLAFWAAALGYVFWSEVPSATVIAGVALVAISTILVRGRRSG